MLGDTIFVAFSDGVPNTSSTEIELVGAEPYAIDLSSAATIGDLAARCHPRTMG